MTFDSELCTLRQAAINTAIRGAVAVQRSMIFEMGFAHFKRASRNPTLIFSSPYVSFVGEPAMDAGGPFREFMSEFFELCVQKYFEKSIGGFNFSCTDKSIMEVVGLAVGYSLLHDGPRFGYLCPFTANRLLNEDSENSILDYVQLLREGIGKNAASVEAKIITKLLSEKEEDYEDIFDLTNASDLGVSTVVSFFAYNQSHHSWLFVAKVIF